VVKNIEGSADGKDASVRELIIRDIPAGRHDSVTSTSAFLVLAILRHSFEALPTFSSHL